VDWVEDEVTKCGSTLVKVNTILLLFAEAGKPICCEWVPEDVVSSLSDLKDSSVFILQTINFNGFKVWFNVVSRLWKGRDGPLVELFELYVEVLWLVICYVVWALTDNCMAILVNEVSYGIISSLGSVLILNVWLEVFGNWVAILNLK